MTNRSVSSALLLPPSEGKALGGRGRWDPARAANAHLRPLAARRVEVARALAAVGGGDAHLLGVGGAHLERARSANVGLLSGAPVLRAAERYTGVVWDHLDLATLAPAPRKRASSSIVVVSGLLGLVGVDDPVPDYRLKMGASLATIGKLSTWWRPAVSAALNGWAARRFVIDLLPHEHRSAWVPDRVKGVSVSFVERDGKVAGHDAKAAKGRLARHVVCFDGHPLDALEAWSDARFDLQIVAL